MEGKPNTRIAVFCVRTGDKYPDEYVHRLRSMVARHLATPHDFYCLTDDTGRHHPDSMIPLPGPDLGACWNKLWLFSANLLPPGRTVLYLDLDIVIVGSLDSLLTAGPGESFLGQPDWNRPFFPQFNSSVMRLRAGAHADILDVFLAQRHSGRLVRRDEWDCTTRSREKTVYWRGWRRFGSDQEWISAHLRPRRPVRSRALPHGEIVSYKSHAMGRPPNGAKVVVFHGTPKPHEVHDPYVLENWR